MSEENQLYTIFFIQPSQSAVFFPLVREVPHHVSLRVLSTLEPGNSRAKTVLAVVMPIDSRHVLGVIVVLVTASLIRLSVCLPMFRQKRKFRGTSLKTLIVFGSGMHRISMHTIVD